MSDLERAVNALLDRLIQMGVVSTRVDANGKQFFIFWPEEVKAALEEIVSGAAR